MTTRAIRYDQLNTDSARTASEAVVWCNYNHNDTEIWHPLQVAVQHQIENAGDTAEDIQTRMANIRNEHYSCANYYSVMTTVYAHLIPQILHYEMDNSKLPTLMREKLIEMRDVAKAKTPKNDYFDG